MCSVSNIYTMYYVCIIITVCAHANGYGEHSGVIEHIVPLAMKGCICHSVKWQIHPFIFKGDDISKIEALYKNKLSTSS